MSELLVLQYSTSAFLVVILAQLVLKGQLALRVRKV
jgi:hypothetical protein